MACITVELIGLKGRGVFTENSAQWQAAKLDDCNEYEGFAAK